MGKIVCDTSKRECMMHRCQNCPGTDALRLFLDEQLDEFDPDTEFHYSQWQTTERATLMTIKEEICMSVWSRVL